MKPLYSEYKHVKRLDIYSKIDPIEQLQSYHSCQDPLLNKTNKRKLTETFLFNQ